MPTPKLRARVTGVGSYAPPKLLTNADFERMVDTCDDWIISRTGIKRRHVADRDTHCSDMTVFAATKAMEMAGWRRDEVDMLIVGTVTPDYRLPSTACVIQEKMGLENAATMDIAAACAGFIHALSIASAYIETGAYRRIIVCGAEKLSSITNYNDRGTCILFGDAAGVVCVEPTTEERGVLSTFMRSDGRLGKLLWIPAGGTTLPMKEACDSGVLERGEDCLFMNGAEVFKHAVRQMGDAALRSIEMAGIKPADVNLIVPHQANIRIIEALAKRLDTPMDRVYVNIEEFGNTSSASVPLAFDEAVRSGRVKEGDNVLMVAFGGGLTWGASIVRW